MLNMLSYTQHMALHTEDPKYDIQIINIAANNYLLYVKI